MAEAATFSFIAVRLGRLGSLKLPIKGGKAAAAEKAEKIPAPAAKAARKRA